MKDIYVDRLKSIFKGMKDRCYSPNRENYAIYGGRGIEICDRWKDSFDNFYEDMRKSYEEHVDKYGEKDTSIDRINVDENYCKENCRWATCKEQANNKRNNVYISCPDGILTLSQVADKYNINYATVKSRYYYYGDNYDAVVLGNTSNEDGILEHRRTFSNLTDYEKDNNCDPENKELYLYWLYLKHRYEGSNEDWYTDYNIFKAWSLANNYNDGNNLVKTSKGRLYTLDNYSYVDRLGYTVSIGDKYGEWTVISAMVKNGNYRYCNVRCKCGKETTVEVKSLVVGRTKMCKSCSIARTSTKHGMARTKIYITWQNIKKRTNPVCDSWKDSFETFYKDTHEEYDRLMGLYDKSEVRFILLDRKGIYEPSNCKWIARVKK